VSKRPTLEKKKKERAIYPNPKPSETPPLHLHRGPALDIKIKNYYGSMEGGRVVNQVFRIWGGSREKAGSLRGAYYVGEWSRATFKTNVQAPLLS